MADGMPTLNEILEGNRQWLPSFAWGGLDVRPRRQMAILTCMDSRYAAQSPMGMDQGNAHVIRNAGGRVTDDAIRSLVLSAHALGTRGCVVIHHTKCGLHGASNDDLRTKVREATGQDASTIEFMPFDDLEQSVREDVLAVRACTLLPADYQVLGFTYDVDTGVLTHVEA
jgi:carbonic anhydrase